MAIREGARRCHSCCASGISQSGHSILSCGGSGSTLIACDELDRTCMGIEIGEKFVDVICKRYIESHDGRTDDVYVIRDGEKLQYADVVNETLSETNAD